MIPLIDPHAIIQDLNLWGWRDFKIETVCGFSRGYVAQIKCGNVKAVAHERAVRLYNFWESEAVDRGVRVPPYSSPDVSRETLQTRLEAVTT